MRQPKTNERVPASFRDPSGFVFQRNGALYRQVQESGKSGYDLLMSSGLYDSLVAKRRLIPHCEVPVVEGDPEAYKVLEPEVVPFISYPYEWSFSALKDAALATLAIQRDALTHGMSLKDASAYNIQFHEGRPVHIDTLSFAAYREGEPWAAYRQFCQQFLAPLALAAYADPALGSLSRIFLDGVPLHLAAKLLPRWTVLRTGLFIHLHLHAWGQRAFEKRGARGGNAGNRRVRRSAMDALIASLENAVNGIRLRPAASEWSGYYRRHSYSEAALASKSAIVDSMLGEIAPHTAWDLGANTGLFSRLAAARGIQTISLEGDAVAVDTAYLANKNAGETRVLSLVLDLANPSPALGWAHEERLSLAQRGPADVALALALIHHLAIAGNVPLDRIAGWLHSLCRHLIIEFVPKGDSQVERLLATREDIFDDYTEDKFVEAFSSCFHIVSRVPVAESSRAIYLLRARVAQ